MADPIDVPVHCSPWTRAAGLSPAGSAGSPAGFLLVDVALPWPGDVATTPSVAALAGLASAHRLRVQATVPPPGAPPRLAWYRPRSGPGFSRYEGTELRAADAGPASVLAAAEALLAGSGTRTGGEVLVCTHGRRDTCCGSAGTSLVMELTAPPASAVGPDTGPAAAPAPVPGAHRGPVATAPAAPAALGRQLRRTSHTGGHRYAPTAIVLPEGTAWAWADVGLLTAVCARTGPMADVAGRYRGCTGLATPEAQALEGAVLADHGWDLLAGARAVTELGRGRHRLELTGPDGGVSRWEAEVARSRSVAVPDCGHPIGQARKTASELRVTGLTRVG